MGGFGWRVSYRLGTGSKALAAWCWQRSPVGALAAAGTVAALPVYESASVLVIPAFVWGAAAWAKGSDAPFAGDWKSKHVGHPEDVYEDEEDEHDIDESELDSTAGEKTTTRDPERSMRDYVEHVVAANQQHRKRQGVHVRELLEGLQHHGSLTDWKPADMRRHLEGLGIPVRDGLGLVIDGKKVNRPGVHHDDLSKHLGRTPVLPPHLVPDLTPR